MNQVMEPQTIRAESTADSVPGQGTKGRLLFWGIFIVLSYVISEVVTPYPAAFKCVISEQWWDLLARKSLELLALAFLIPRLLRRDGLSLADIGFAPRMSLQELRWGLLGGSAIWLLHVLLLRAAEIRTGGEIINAGMVTAIKTVDLGPAEFVGLVLVIIIQGPLLEEIVYRGCLMSSVRSLWERRPWPVLMAVLISGLIFAVVHAVGHPLYLIVYAVTGMGLALLYQKSGSLFAAVMAHATVNTLCVLKAIFVSWVG